MQCNLPLSKRMRINIANKVDLPANEHKVAYGPKETYKVARLFFKQLNCIVCSFQLLLISLFITSLHNLCLFSAYNGSHLLRLTQETNARIAHNLRCSSTDLASISALAFAQTSKQTRIIIDFFARKKRPIIQHSSINKQFS